jgi:hypothetical protein
MLRDGDTDARRAAPRHFLIDDLAAVLRKPTASPVVQPAEVIATVLTVTQWTPGRMIGPDDLVVEQILSSLKQMGWSITPTEAPR